VNLLPERGVILDIGANIGIMSYHLCKKRPQSEVHGYEPIPQNFKALKSIKEKYNLNNLKLAQLALGNESGTVEMILPTVQNVKMQGLSHVKHESITDFNDGEVLEATIKTLDEIYLEGTQRITGIKLDVENFEYFVLEGGREIIKRDHPIIYVELWDNENRAKTFELLNQLGYTNYVIQGMKMIKWDPSITDKQNFIFISGSDITQLSFKDLRNHIMKQ
jgi:FkbM family methyltransferase